MPHNMAASAPERTTSKTAFIVVFETEREITVDSYWLTITSVNGALLLVELY
jgi:hypothetical protein